MRLIGNVVDQNTDSDLLEDLVCEMNRVCEHLEIRKERTLEDDPWILTHASYMTKIQRVRTRLQGDDEAIHIAVREILHAYSKAKEP